MTRNKYASHLVGSQRKLYSFGKRFPVAFTRLVKSRMNGICMTISAIRG